MPLEAYRRGKKWWAKGRVEFNDRPITGYIRESTGASTEAGARKWIHDRTESELRKHLVGDEQAPITFFEAILHSEPDPQAARYLEKVVKHIGDRLVDTITEEDVQTLGPKILPKASTETWRRWIIVPVRSVILNAHAKRLCGPIKIRSYRPEACAKQDKVRGKPSKIKKTPGSWKWLEEFRGHAPYKIGVLAHLMFVTGARISQATSIGPEHLLDLHNRNIVIPGAKGSEDRTIEITQELADELAGIIPKVPRGWPRCRENLRLFGYAGKSGPKKDWDRACEKMQAARLTPHAAGRHGFAQEMMIRNRVDAKAVAAYGGWKSTEMLNRVYTHAEDVDEKILRAIRTGRGLPKTEKSPSL
ncbi:integrase [Rubellimicrobium rubrum]|uniref:Integrase n=1 Tax=Rubellimicrobium rubrum TaxID=2585369 RepID=A0A5C4N4B0_9RHOB|nr:tyrosine-type recombinase/integrase [Rubellimicrobium rubrum]TNC51104.1 integrase [Rubellimicrobium rubrum]